MMSTRNINHLLAPLLPKESTEKSLQVSNEAKMSAYLGFALTLLFPPLSVLNGQVTESIEPVTSTPHETNFSLEVEEEIDLHRYSLLSSGPK